MESCSLLQLFLQMCSSFSCPVSSVSLGVLLSRVKGQGSRVKGQGSRYSIPFGLGCCERTEHRQSMELITLHEFTSRWSPFSSLRSLSPPFKPSFLLFSPLLLSPLPSPLSPILTPHSSLLTPVNHKSQVALTTQL